MLWAHDKTEVVNDLCAEIWISLCSRLRLNSVRLRRLWGYGWCVLLETWTKSKQHLKITSQIFISRLHVVRPLYAGRCRWHPKIQTPCRWTDIIYDAMCTLSRCDPLRLSRLVSRCYRCWGLKRLQLCRDKQCIHPFLEFGTSLFLLTHWFFYLQRGSLLWGVSRVQCLFLLPTRSVPGRLIFGEHLFNFRVLKNSLFVGPPQQWGKYTGSAVSSKSLMRCFTTLIRPRWPSNKS